MAESFFATLEREVLNRRRFRSQAEARMAIFQWLEGWYNPHRRLGPRLSFTHQLREETAAAECLKPKSVPVHETGQVHFFRYKSIIGEGFRARSSAGQGAEAVLACNVLNRMRDLGRPASYAIRR